jgi:putative salt-induced outer membrane protein YdiY
LRSPRNFYIGLAEFLQSNEQQLDLRTTLGGGIGHIFSSTNNSLVAVYAGADWNNEHYSAEATNARTGDSAEAVVGTQLNFFRFKTTNFLVNASVYPSLTEPGRTRLNLNTTLKLRIAKNLYWNFNYYLNVDSQPPQNLPKTDYGSTSSLGWTF